jgi:hypothetical protein
MNFFLQIAKSFSMNILKALLFTLSGPGKKEILKEEIRRDMGYENVRRMLEELEKTNEEFGVLLGKIERNMLSTAEWVAFDNIFGVLLRFKLWYLKGCVDYHNKGNTPCAKNKLHYSCNGCAINDLTPWRADPDLRCPLGNSMHTRHAMQWKNSTNIE